MGNEKDQDKLEEQFKNNTDLINTKEDDETEDLNLDDISEIDIKGIEEINGIKLSDAKSVKLRREVVRASFSGPLPHPSTLKGYEQICPGAADRIIKMAENQMHHRHDIEKKFLSTNSRNSFLGILFAFILGLVIALGGIYCVIIGKQVSGLLFGGAGLSTIIIAFIKGTKLSVETNESDSNAEDEE